MADINLRITADDSDVINRLKGVDSGLRTVQSSLDKTGNEGQKAFQGVDQAVVRTEKQVESLESSLGQVGKIIGGILGADIIRFGVQAFKNFGTQAIQAAGDYEQLNTSIETFLGSQEKANQLIQEVADFSTITPFTPEEVNETTKSLLAFGIQQEKIIPTLKIVGDVSAGSGKNLKELAAIYGQVATAGRLQGEQLRSFTLAGIPILEELAKNLDVTKGRVRDLVSAGEVGFSDVENAFQTMTSEGGNFFNLMNKQSETFQGRVSTLAGLFNDARRQFGEQLLPVLKEVTETGIEFFQTLDIDRLKSVAAAISTGVQLLIKFGPLLLKTAAAWAAVSAANLVAARSIQAQNKAKQEAQARELELQQLQLQSSTAQDKLTIARNRYTQALAASNKEEGRSILLNNDLVKARENYRNAQINASAATKNYQNVANTATGATQRFTIAQKASALAARGKALALNVVRTAMNAIPFLAIASGIALLVQNWQKITDVLTGVSSAQRSVINASQDLRKEYIKEGVEVVNLFNTLRDFNATKGEQEAAIKRLNDDYPEILKNYDLEKASLQEINAAQKAVTESIFETAKARIQQELVVQSLERQAEIQQNINRLTTEGANAWKDGIAPIEGLIEASERQLRKEKNSLKERLQGIRDLQEFQLFSNEELTEAEINSNQTKLNSARRYYDSIKSLSDDDLQNELENKQSEIEAERQMLQTLIQFRQQRQGAGSSGLDSAALEAYEKEEQAINEQIRFLEASTEQIKEILNDRSKFTEKAAEEDAKFVDKVRKEYETLFNELRSVQLDFELEGLTPAERIRREAKLASEAIDELEGELRKRADSLGIEFEFEDEFDDIQRQINLDKEKQLIELELKQREDAINRRFNLESKSAKLIQQISEEGLNIEEIRARRSIQIERQRLDELEKIRERELEQVVADPSSDNEAVQAAKDALAEIRLAFEDLNEQERQLNEQINDRVESDALDRISMRRDLALAEIDLLEESTDRTLNLEQDKERKRLEIQRQALINQREILIERYGPDSEEIQLLDAQIKLIGIKMQEIGQGENPFRFIRTWLKDALQIDDEQLDALVGSIALATDAIQGLFEQSLQSSIESNEELLNQLRERRQGVESELEKEIQAQEKGYANNVESKRRELEEIQAEEERAEQELAELKAKQAKREAIRSAAQTVTQLVLAGARFFQEGSKLGPILGPILAAAAIATMISTIRSIKDAGSSEITSAFKGGPVENYLGTGRTDKNGRKGHKVEGTNLQLGLREFVVAEAPATEHKTFLHQINDGEFKNVDLTKMAKNAANLKGDFSPVFMVEHAPEAVFTSKEEAKNREREYNIDRGLANNFRELMNYFDKRPEYVPVTKGGYIEISKNRRKKVINS